MQGWPLYLGLERSLLLRRAGHAGRGGPEQFVPIWENSRYGSGPLTPLGEAIGPEPRNSLPGEPGGWQPQIPATVIKPDGRHDHWKRCCRSPNYEAGGFEISAHDSLTIQADG